MHTLIPLTFRILVLPKGGRFLEAPVSGSKAQAEGGALIMICAGDRSLYDEIESNDLKAMGKVRLYNYTLESTRQTRARLVTIKGALRGLISTLRHRLHVVNVHLHLDKALHEQLFQSDILSPSRQILKRLLGCCF